MKPQKYKEKWDLEKMGENLGEISG